ncbi:MAG: phenylalanine--tRNA ligase beta subunit-related protein [Candidatus Acidiferrales bacterium]
MQIQIELPGVKLVVVEADDVRVVSVDAALAKLMDEVCVRKRQEFTVETLAESEPVRNVRAMFREWGMDPSKYRPSSEALLRRVVQGKGLYRVSNVVDIGNLGSIETGCPYGCYDRSKINAPVSLRHGTAGEKYEGIGKQIWHLEGSGAHARFLTECGDQQAEGPASAICISFCYALRYLHRVTTPQSREPTASTVFVQDNAYFARVPPSAFGNSCKFELSC